MARRADPPRPRPTIPTRQRATAESLRRRLETALAELSHLRQENNQLRDELARHYGNRRATNVSQSPPPNRRR